jgi:hypothetical protein
MMCGIKNSLTSLMILLIPTMSGATGFSTSAGSTYVGLVPNNCPGGQVAIGITSTGTLVCGSGGGGGTVTAVTASSPLFSSGGATPNITCQTASTSQAGCISAASFTTFNTTSSGGPYLPLTGGTMTGPIDMSGHNINSIGQAGFNGTALTIAYDSVNDGISFFTAGTLIPIANFSSPSANPEITFFGPLNMNQNSIFNLGTLGFYSGGQLADNGSGGILGPNGNTLIDSSNSLYYGDGSTFTAYGNHIIWPNDGSDMTDGTNLYVDVNSGGVLGFDQYRNGATMQSDGSGGINYGGGTGFAAHLGYDGSNLTTWSLGTGNSNSGTPAFIQTDNGGSISANTDPSSSSSVINLTVGGVVSGVFNSSGLKLPLQNASTVLVTDSSNNVVSSSITSTQLGLITTGKGSTAWGLSTGSLTSIVANEIIGGGKTGQAMTVRSATVAAAGFTCVANPTLKLLDCGTSAGACTSGTTTLATCTITAANTLTTCTINNASIASGHFWAWEITAGTCTALNATGSAELGSALQ